MSQWRGITALLWLCVAGCSALPTTAPAVLEPVVAAPEIRPQVTLRAAPAAEPSHDLWATIRAGLQLTDTKDPRIDAAVDWFTEHPKLIAALEPGAQLYYAYMVTEIERRGLPMEVALLPIVESTLNPYALSRSGAAGMWQLMPDTAARYGVSIDWWYDGRRDPVDSTRAALDHLQYLHDYFDGDWLLAMAAYNCGEGCIGRAQQKARSSSYWKLELSDETSKYVPRILALGRLIARPDDYGLRLPTVDLEPAFTLASIDGQVDLGQIARLTALGHDELFRLNPGLNRRATPPEGPHRLLVPTAMASGFSEIMQNYPETHERWLQYVVKDGDSLADIARRHHASIDALRTNNAIKGNLIRVGQKLIIPVSAKGTMPENPLVATFTPAASRSYKVAPGDSLSSISRRFGTSVAAIIGSNSLDQHAPIRVGQTLQIPSKARPAASAERTIEYRVQRGDSLWQIANRFKVSVAEIARWNSLEPDSPLRPGSQLRLHM